MTVDVSLDSKVKIIKPDGKYEMHTVVEVKFNEVTVKHRSRKGKLNIPNHRLMPLGKTFRGAKYSYKTSINLK